MITLSPTLAAHQKQNGRLPTVRAFVYQSRRSYPILRWTRYYTGAESAAPIALAVAADGSLIRARNAAGTLYTSRVTSPGPGSTYSSWTSMGAIAFSGAGIALAAKNGEITLVYADAAGTGLSVRHSADNGASWGAATVRATEASQIAHIAAAYNSAGDLCLFYSLNASSTLKRLRRTAGVWDAAGTAWTRAADVTAITGIAAAYHDGDFALIVTATVPTPTGDKRAYAYRMGDTSLPLNAWSSPNTIAESDAASTVTYTFPALLNLSHLLGAFTHTETGNVPASQIMLTHPPAATNAAGQWAEPGPHEAVHANGLALASYDQLDCWATTPSGVWYARRNTDALDLTPQVLNATCTLTPTSASARLVLTPANSSLLPPPSSLFTGADLLLQPGYLSGPSHAFEYGTSFRFTITRIAYAHGDGQATITIDATGPWEAAARWRAPQAWQTAAGSRTRASTFSRVAGRAAIPAAAASSSTPFTTYTPAFAISPGESGRSVLSRLLAVVTDHARPAASGGFTTVDPRTTDASTETYGGAGNHPIVSFADDSTLPGANWLRLSGPDRYADAATAASVYQHGPILDQERNLDATTNTKTQEAAAAALRRAYLATPIATLTAPFHCGQELFDVITVNEPTLGISARLYRVIGLRLDFSTHIARHHFRIHLTLGER